MPEKGRHMLVHIMPLYCNVALLQCGGCLYIVTVLFIYGIMLCISVLSIIYYILRKYCTCKLTPAGELRTPVLYPCVNEFPKAANTAVTAKAAVKRP